MIKKVIYLYLIFLVCQVVIVSCCPTTSMFNFKLNTLKIENSDLINVVSENDLVNKNNYRIKCSMDVTANQVTSDYVNSFIASSYAFTCDSDGYEGLESPITRFEIRCNKSIFGTPPNIPLSLNNLQVYKDGFTVDSKNIRYSVNDWLKILNEGKFNIAFEWYFEFVEPITSDDYLQFFIVLELENGQVFQANTKPVKLQ